MLNGACCNNVYIYGMLENIQKIIHSFKLNAEFPLINIVGRSEGGTCCADEASQALVFLVGGSLGGTRGPTGGGL